MVVRNVDCIICGLVRGIADAQLLVRNECIVYIWNIKALRH